MSDVGQCQDHRGTPDLHIMKYFKTRSGLSLVIREAEPSDAEDLLNYAETISRQTDFLSFGPGESGLTLEQERDLLARCRSTDNQMVLIGLVETTIVAAAMFIGESRKRERHTGMVGLSVDRGHWNQGIGSLMMDELILWARENLVVRKLQLKVRTDNYVALQLYLRKGFRVEGTITEDFCIDHQFYDHYLMASHV